MQATRLKGGQDAFVRLRLPKGVLVVLTLDEYATALYRGKMERRAQRRALHAHQLSVQQEATALAWITKGAPMPPEMIAPQPTTPSALVLEPDPHEDIPDPPLPTVVEQAVQNTSQEAAPAPEWQQHEALLQGFLGLLQGRLKAWIEDEHKALQTARATCDLEHQRLCQALEAVTKLAQQAVTTSQQTNEHAWYSLGDSLKTLQERGMQLRLDPYQATVQALSPHGFPVTIQVAKSDVSELIGALPALTGWLAQEHYKPCEP
jgi:hypothetical protein